MEYDDKFGLLSAVKKYPVGGVDPRENFITEAWTWILKSNKLFCDKFIFKLFGINGDYSSYRIESQFPVPNGFVDLIIYQPNEKCFIFEHKTGHTFEDNQIEKYIAWALNQSFHIDSIFSATVADRFIDHKQSVDKTQTVIQNITWNSISKFIQDEVDSNKYSDVEVFVLRNFQNLLIDSDLTHKEKEIQMETLKNFYKVSEAIQSLELIFSSIKERNNWDHVYKKIPRKNNRPPRVPITQYGRLGISFGRPEDWTPNLFFGVLIDSYDHLVEPINKDLGPDLCLIIDIDKNRFSNYENNQTYLDMKHQFEKLTKLHKFAGWHFHDHLSDSSKKKNKWHPLYFRKPLIEVLKDAADHTLQQETVKENMNSVLNAVLGIGCESHVPAFLELRKQLMK